MASSRSARMRRVCCIMRRPSLDTRNTSSMANIRRIVNSYPAYPRTEATKAARPYGAYGIAPISHQAGEGAGTRSYTSSTLSRLGAAKPALVRSAAFHLVRAGETVLARTSPAVYDCQQGPTPRGTQTVAEA